MVKGSQVQTQCMLRSGCQRNLLTMHAITSTSQLGVSTTTKTDRNDQSHDSPSIRRGFSSSGKGAFGSLGSINTAAVSSPTGTGASSAFGLGTGAFASFGSSKTPKTPGATFDSAKKPDSGDEAKDVPRRPGPTSRKSLGAIRTTADTSSAAPKQPAPEHPLQHAWIVYYRPPTSKNSDYEKSIKPMARIDTVEGLWKVYTHLKKPSKLIQVSDYHVFKDGIRPVWEDDGNKEGGKFTLRLKKGVVDRLWESLFLTMTGDQFGEFSDEICGAVVSARQGEDVISLWTKYDGGRNVKIRDTIRRLLELPQDTQLPFKSHNDAIQSREEVDKARAEKTAGRRNTLIADKD